MLNPKTLFTAGAFFFCLGAGLSFAQDNTPIDRHALVSRHDIDWPSLDGQIPLGNGNFAMNADGTGLETFGGNTMSHWCWHKFPLPPGVQPSEVVPWASTTTGHLTGATTPIPDLKDWLSHNPHPLNLGRLGFVDSNGRRLEAGDCRETGRHLDLWTGLLTSHFSYHGEDVTVQTCVDPKLDAIAVRVESPLLGDGRLGLRLDFPAPAPAGTGNPLSGPGPWVGDFSNPNGHKTQIVANAGRRLDLLRTIDDTVYHVTTNGLGVKKTEPVKFELVRAHFGVPGSETDVTDKVRDLAAHGDVQANITQFGDPALNKAKRLEIVYLLNGSEHTDDVAENQSWSAPNQNQANQINFDSTGSNTAELVCQFSPDAIADAPPSFDAIKTACADHWQKFWSTGGAIDLSGSSDPRWKELERRIVLSQYETAVQSAGDYPPAEVGLTGIDPWQGKFHTEMVWWHLSHFALWDRWAMAEKALTYYQKTENGAAAIAKNFDYKGLMWPKTTGPDGVNDGWPPEMALLWRIPPPILFAELDYRLHPTQATLDKWKDVVLGTAEFMADYPVKDATTDEYNLDPVWPCCEQPIGRNTIFELAEWRYVLGLAQTWRVRLGLPRDDRWDSVIKHLAPLPVKDGLYVYRADWNNTYTQRRFDHLDILGFFAMFPPFPGEDQDTEHRTLMEVARKWDWEGTWGWDFPWMAMAAARMGEPKIAMDALLNPAQKNNYDERGLCTGGPGPYLPGNGGLLYATALMAAGWDGAPKKHAPGFPDDGSWTVKWEGLKTAP